MHLFINAYILISSDTARTLFYPLHEHIEIETVRKYFRTFIIKDYVKSVKDTDFPKSISSRISQDEFDAFLTGFLAVVFFAGAFFDISLVILLKSS